MNGTRFLTLFGSTAILCGCSGLTQMQDTAAKFDQGVHSASVAESSLFNQVQLAECRRNFYRQAFDFATVTRDSKSHLFPELGPTLDLRASACVKQELTDDELGIRLKLLATITLYADAIQTLTNGASDTDLSTNAKSVAGDIQSLGKQQKFTTAHETDVAALNSAVVAIASMILDHSSYKHVKDAAAAMSKPLSTVVDGLKAENIQDVVGLASKADAFINEMRASLSASRDISGPASFLDIVSAKSAIESLTIAPVNVAQLNQTLDAVVNANEALARTTNGGAIPEISSLISRAQQASSVFSAAK